MISKLLCSLRSLGVALACFTLILASAAPPANPKGEKITIAVVGGTSFGTPEKFASGLATAEGDFQYETKAGPSPRVYRMRYKGVPFYYIRIYGQEARQPGEPEHVYHIRTWTALHELGVTHVLSGASSGGIRPEMTFDDIVILDDFIEWRFSRPVDILEEVGISRPGIFPNYAIPLSPSLRRLLIEESKKRLPGYTGKLYERGVFAQFAPGRFESPAEVQAMARAGADLTSMNQATCIIYARQLGIRFASISSIANPATGVGAFTFKQMQDSVQRIAAFTIPVVLEVIARIPKDALDPEPSSTGEPFKGDYLNPDEKK
jgi:purine nucleoside phosphorylase